ncbi:hypothetical protein BGZ49_007684 [Haplosporangium sp. Z 27]|nr:hypothetical protein BGZ49_007684 [Haplosporangium sp. Z 27]
MAVTTRNRTTPATAKKANPTSKKSAVKRTTKKAPVESESEEDKDEDDHSEDNDEVSESEDNEEEPEENQEDASDDDTFKIHTPKASVEPKITPAVLPSMTYEDDSEDEDSDAAPEAESLSSAKAKVLDAQDKEKSFLSKIQAEQKAKRVEREEKLKAQKEQSKKKAQKVESIIESKDAPTQSTTKSGLPTMLPMDLLESVANMENESESPAPKTNDKKRKHMRPEDFALMELEAELKAEAQKRKKTEKTQKNVGPVTVKVLDQSRLAKGHTIPETIVDFRKQHFYGSKIQRKDAVLNLSQRNIGAASKFSRRK